MTAVSYRKENAPHFRLILPVSRQNVVGSSHATRVEVCLQHGSVPAAVRCFRVNAARIVFLMTVPQVLAPWEVQVIQSRAPNISEWLQVLQNSPFQEPEQTQLPCGASEWII